MKPVDVIVLCLAVFIGLAICLPLMSILLWDQPYDCDRAKLLGGLIASSIAIVSIYVGARLNDRDDKD
jgi:hypothetical protein